MSRRPFDNVTIGWKGWIMGRYFLCILVYNARILCPMIDLHFSRYKKFLFDAYNLVLNDKLWSNRYYYEIFTLYRLLLKSHFYIYVLRYVSNPLFLNTHASFSYRSRQWVYVPYSTWNILSVWLLSIYYFLFVVLDLIPSRNAKQILTISTNFILYIWF